MKKIYTILAVALLSYAMQSCIRDEIKDCDGMQVTVTVKDKNYFNVDMQTIEPRKSEELSFRQYIPTLFYILRDAQSGKVVEQQGVFPVEGDSQTFTLSFCNCLPYGKYILTIWGGLTGNTRIQDNPLIMLLHADSKETEDIYLSNDTITYGSTGNNYTVDMERVTGKLVIEAENLPQEFYYFSHTINNISRDVNNEFHYGIPASMYKEGELPTSAPVNIKTILAPTVNNSLSTLGLEFFNSPLHTGTKLVSKNVDITLKRNELTSVRYVYDEESDQFTIYILVNAVWEKVNSLEI